MSQTLQQELQTLNRLYKRVDKIYSGLASRFGLTDTAFWVLYAISRAEEPLTQNDLCSEWFYPVQTINSAVSNLLKKGLVRLEVIPGTRNRKNILLTDEGKALASSTIQYVDEIERNAFCEFTEEERELYLSLFKRHLENLEREEKRVLDSIKEGTTS